MSAPRRGGGERGTALLSVLLMALVMGVLVVAMLDDVRFGLRRSGNAESVAQAQRFALGAEALARRKVAMLARDDVRTAEWSGRPLVFPIENGLLSATLRDGTACFNLNSVVQGSPNHWQRQEMGVRQYMALLDALEFSAAQAQALSDTLVDWIDTDAQRSPLGAEDSTYLALRPAYRSAGTLLAEPSELRAIHGYDATVYARIRPHVCTLPQARLSPVNVNALAPEQAPLLTMLTLGAVRPAEARKLIAARPARGWPDATAFFSLPPIQQAKPDPSIYEQVELRSTWFEFEARVDYAGAQVTLNALLRQDGTRPARLASRRWTEHE